MLDQSHAEEGAEIGGVKDDGNATDVASPAEDGITITPVCGSTQFPLLSSVKKPGHDTRGLP